jgi:hypothetical protein
MVQEMFDKAAYEAHLRDLSEASVRLSFNAFTDIPWDDPAYVWRADDRQFVLSDADVIGAHPWYQALPLERQIEIGMFRFAQIAKVGRQFEQVLVAGLMHHLIGMDSGNPEFRYVMHEVTEETHHIQMFQEAVNRAHERFGIDPQGAPAYFQKLAPFITQAGIYLPTIFFIGILAGEEPIDHLQKSMLRDGGRQPLISRIMQIHIAEEARHISFAHEWLAKNLAQAGRVKRFGLSLAYPLAMWWLCTVIMKPTRRDLRAMGIPRAVARDMWWRSPLSDAHRREMFGDVRLLADRLGIRRGPARWLWKLLRIDGRPSRYRGETHERDLAA